MKVIETVGLPGSGKSTWSKEFIKKNPMYKRVNRDDIRLMLHAQTHAPRKEKLITKIENELIFSILESGFNVIIDATNLNDKRVAERHKSVKNKFSNVEFEIKDFRYVPVETCIKNDLKRSNSVGSDVIYNFANKYIEEKVEENKCNSSLPNAYIFDIDGSLALMNGRSPFAWDKVGTDICREDIKRLSNVLSIDHEIIVMSGRDGSCRELTEKWLEDNEICYNYLLMREAGDCRKDTIIKRELFDKYVRGNFNIYGVFDDRPSVCREWKRMGLTVFNIDSRIWMSEF